MNDWIEPCSKLLALASAIVAVLAALIWHLSADAQEALNLVTNTSSADFKAALTISLKLNSQAAILSAISAGLAAFSALASK